MLEARAWAGPRPGHSRRLLLYNYMVIWLWLGRKPLVLHWEGWNKGAELRRHSKTPRLTR
jgi:hypothetical protein